MHRGCAEGLCTGVACARVVGTLSQSDYTGLHVMVAHAGVVHRGCVHKGGGDTQPISLHRGCAQGLRAQGLCTRVACRGCMHKGGGDTQPIRLHRGCTQWLHVQGLHAQGWWGHSANLITQGLRARVACAGVVHKGCVHRGCTQSIILHGLHAMVACAGVVCKGGGDTQSIRLHRGCMQGLHAQG